MKDEDRAFLKTAIKEIKSKVAGIEMVLASYSREKSTTAKSRAINEVLQKLNGTDSDTSLSA